MNKPKMFPAIIMTMVLALTFTALSADAKKKTRTVNPLTTSYCSMIQSYGAWTDVEMPVSLRLSKPKSISLSGRATFVRDKFINISLRILGFEVGALTVTTDSVFAYEKHGKRYIAEDLSSLLHGLPVTVGNIQAMLLGRPFIPGEQMITSADDNRFDLTPLDDADLPDAWLMTSREEMPGGASCMWVAEKTILAILVTTLSGHEGSMTYGDISLTTPAGAVASEVNLNIISGDRVIDADLTWKLRSAKWNSGITPVVKIPKGYKRIDAASLMKMIEKL